MWVPKIHVYCQWTEVILVLEMLRKMKLNNLNSVLAVISDIHFVRIHWGNIVTVLRSLLCISRVFDILFVNSVFIIETEYNLLFCHFSGIQLCKMTIKLIALPIIHVCKWSLKLQSWLDLSSISIVVGYWRVLDFDFLVQVMTHLLQLCDENDWTHSGIPVEECITVLEELFPRWVLEHLNCISVFQKSTCKSTCIVHIVHNRHCV